MVRLYIAGFILLLLAGLSASTYIFYLKWQVDGQRYEQVVGVNKANARAAKELREDLAAERAATEKELAATQQRATAIEGIKRDVDELPDAQKPAGAFFDGLSKRLRSPNSGTAD